jgi:hypothetical protein
MAEDILFDVRNAFLLSSFQTSIAEAQKLKVTEDDMLSSLRFIATILNVVDQ